jgi:hypothetical protein
MSFDGNGTFNQATTPVVSGTVISSTNYNSQNTDYNNGLSNVICRDGQSTILANLPMSGYRHTGVGNAVARSDYAAMGQVQDGAGIWCGTAGGTANALTLTPTPAITTYAAGQVFRFTAGASPNSGATTVAVSGLTAIAIQNSGAALTGGEIAAGRQYAILYDGTQFQLQPFSASASATYAANTFVANATTGTAAPTGVALAASQLAGRGSTGNVAAITLGTNLSISGTTLDASGGVIVDRAYAEYTTSAALTVQLPYDDTIPQNTEGTQVLSASITPKTTTNRVRARAVLFGGPASTDGQIVAALFRNSGANAIAATTARTLAVPASTTAIVLEFEDVPGSTSSQTYNIRVGHGASGNNAWLNGDNAGRKFGGAARCTLILEEITA